MKKYSLAVCGGTFDLLHSGHKSFLKEIFENSERAIIGLTSDEYAAKKNLEIQKFDFRKNELINYLNTFAKDDYEILEIHDVFGPLLDKDLMVEALFVTPETKNGAEIVNKRRKELNFVSLKVEIIDMKKAEDGGFISSTRIRKGEINRDGHVYIKKEWSAKTFRLPQTLRNELQKPFGKILHKVPDKLEGSKVITIGDITTQEFNKKSINQILSIVDFQVQREEKFTEISELVFNGKTEIEKVKNLAGEINGKIFGKIKNSLESKNRKIILIDGEEDLIVIPAILISPLGFRIYYGQPNVGLVEIIVKEEIKEKIYKLLNKFEVYFFDK